jgi:methylated-DNA-[protein]-cysteine S-methyltransferase
MYSSKIIDSPVGKLQLVGSHNGLRAILWEGEDGSRIGLGPCTEDDAHPVLVKTQQQLEEYFAGQRKTFDLPLDFVGTEFQKQVWTALLQIPFGATQTYSQVASKLGNPKAVRAVGAANGKNPISIVAPCHRVVGASGDLTGFAGGLENKKRLLELEGGHSAPTLW